MGRPAQQVLDEYMRELRASDAYRIAKLHWVMSMARSECYRVLAESDFSNFSETDILPPPLPNGDLAFGSAKRRAGGAGDYVFDFHFIERHSAYNFMSVNHALYPEGNGSVWLGECNNSARVDLNDPAEAWACWAARESVDGHRRVPDGPVTITVELTKSEADAVLRTWEPYSGGEQRQPIFWARNKIWKATREALGVEGADETR